MENSFQTSFIPKKPVTSSISDREPRSFFSLISVFILIISIIAAGGLFLYKNYLLKQQGSFSSSLSVARSSFEKETIDELELFDKRTESAKLILNNHIVLSPLFELLGEITIPQIQYTDFEQQTNEKGSFVSMRGVARDYRSIALQAEVFNSTKGSSLKNVLFYDLTKDKNNNVSFYLKFNVDPALLSYGNISLLDQTANPSVAPETLSNDLENQTQ